MNDHGKTKEQLIHELTELRRQVDALKAPGQKCGPGHELYENFFNLSGEMLCVAGLDGYFKLLNPAFEKTLGYTSRELLGKSFSEFIHPEDRKKKCTQQKSSGSSTSGVCCEERYLCKDGSCKWLSWTEYKDADEGLIYAVARDITRQRQTEDALETVRDEISTLKEHFLKGELEHREAFSFIITKSRKMAAVFQYIEAVASYLKPIFITGETGVGKELIAGAVHGVSGLKGPFIEVNVAGLDDTMFSDTLFGHSKGAYTGADNERKGMVARASEGTLLLDEIGDLSESSQVKLLRLLEEQTYYPLGSDRPEKSNARIIACSNQDIQQQIVDGKFRRDLYYRLCTHQVHIPPLRDRVEDIPMLLDYFIEDAALSQKKKKPAYPGELIILLSNYNFPGNIRELKAMVFDAVAQHKSGMLSMESFKQFMHKKGAGSVTASFLQMNEHISMLDIFGHFPTLKEIEDYLISDALKRSDGNQGIAAALLGIKRQALNRRLKRKSDTS
jgi:PAS domain S-box-containing protein